MVAPQLTSSAIRITPVEQLPMLCEEKHHSGNHFKYVQFHKISTLSLVTIRILASILASKLFSWLLVQKATFEKQWFENVKSSYTNRKFPAQTIYFEFDK